MYQRNEKSFRFGNDQQLLLRIAFFFKRERACVIKFFYRIFSNNISIGKTDEMHIFLQIFHYYLPKNVKSLEDEDGKINCNVNKNRFSFGYNGC